MSIITQQHKQIAQIKPNTHVATDASNNVADLWDHPLAPRIEPVTDRVVVEFAGRRIADSTRALRICRSNAAAVYCIPRADVRTEYLVPVTTRPVDGPLMPLQFWHVLVDTAVETMAAWSFPAPPPALEALRDTVAFNASKMDACFVGDVPAVADGRRGHGWLTIDRQLLATLQACTSFEYR